MGISRRELIVGATVASTLAASASVSACSPVDFEIPTLSGRFFALIGRGEWVQAKEYLAEDATLSVVSSAGGHLYSEPQAIVEVLGRLLSTEGFNMVGDGRGDDALGGMYWRQVGPWLCSDMLKGDAVTVSGCGGDVWGSMFSVLTDPFTVEGKLSTILLVESFDFIIGPLEMSREFEPPVD
ncbi:hypothetical protein ERY430_80052 [Erythrobacter sp. EC-HK427]|nr:hypothetical protein ERY430_80052 [Erythrobacter sp. EC-HK427]